MSSPLDDSTNAITATSGDNGGAPPQPPPPAPPPAPPPPPPVPPVASKYAKLFDGSRTLIENIGTVSCYGSKVSLKDKHGEYLVSLEFDSEADAQAQLDDVSAQIDAYEAARTTTPISRSRGRRRLYRR